MEGDYLWKKGEEEGRKEGGAEREGGRRGRERKGGECMANKRF